LSTEGLYIVKEGAGDVDDLVKRNFFEALPEVQLRRFARFIPPVDLLM
jgi:hypothetical protein